MEKRTVSLSVIIPTYNVEIFIGQLLSQILPWADEVIICDSFSTDRTLEIARKHNVRIIQHEYINSASQKNWAVTQTSHDWVFIIDADELPEPALLQEIDSFLSDIPKGVELAFIPRKNKFWGELPGNGVNYPDYQSRLFNKRFGKYQEKEVHAQVVSEGLSICLKHALIHDDFTDISSWWLRNNRYFKYELIELTRSKKRWNRKMQYIKPIYVFFKVYLQKKMFKYGFKGFFAAFQWAVYHFFVYAKLYEFELKEKQMINEKSANPY
jgi:glycosyltransferase involved in cell wall biosynthesis